MGLAIKQINNMATKTECTNGTKRTGKKETSKGLLLTLFPFAIQSVESLMMG